MACVDADTAKTSTPAISLITLSSLQTSEKTPAHGPDMFQGGRFLRGRHLVGFSGAEAS